MDVPGADTPHLGVQHGHSAEICGRHGNGTAIEDSLRHFWGLPTPRLGGKHFTRGHFWATHSGSSPSSTQPGFRLPGVVPGPSETPSATPPSALSL